MKETLNQFFDRIFVNCSKEKVLVWDSKAFKQQITPPNNKKTWNLNDKEKCFKPAIWSLDKARNYINYLEEQKV